MESDAAEQRRGYLWFFIAGAVAVSAAISLYRVDISLTYSNSRYQRGQTLGEIRGAAAALESASIDDRSRSY